MNSVTGSDRTPGEPEILSRLILLGTIHRDPKGLSRSFRSLEALRPDLVLIEMSPFARVFRKRNRRSFLRTLRDNAMEAARRRRLPFSEALKHPEIVAIRRQIGFPFEYRAASCYAGKTGARLLLVDYSPFSRKWITSWAELISVDNLANLLSLPPDVNVFRETYRLAARRIHGGALAPKTEIGRNGGEYDRLWIEREHYMARQVRAALYTLRPERPVYIGGWWHLTADGVTPTLRDLLSVDLNRCHLLCDVLEERSAGRIDE